MTTPQSQLHYLSNKICDLYEFFKGDEESEDIMYRIGKLESQMMEIISAQRRQEELMGLIIKLLNKGG